MSAAMTDTQEPMFLLMKRGYYWRPNAQGYTSSVSDAGRYTEAEARAYCKNPDVSMIPAPTPTDTQKPVAWITPEALDDLLRDKSWVHGAVGEFRSENKAGFTAPLYTQDQLDAAVRAERERCAKIADDGAEQADRAFRGFTALNAAAFMHGRAKAVAAAIREGE